MRWAGPGRARRRGVAADLEGGLVLQAGGRTGTGQGREQAPVVGLGVWAVSCCGVGFGTPNVCADTRRRGRLSCARMVAWRARSRRVHATGDSCSALVHLWSCGDCENQEWKDHRQGPQGFPQPEGQEVSWVVDSSFFLPLGLFVPLPLPVTFDEQRRRWIGVPCICEQGTPKRRTVCTLQPARAQSHSWC